MIYFNIKPVHCFKYPIHWSLTISATSIWERQGYETNCRPISLSQPSDILNLSSKHSKSFLFWSFYWQQRVRNRRRRLCIVFHQFRFYDAYRLVLTLTVSFAVSLDEPHSRFVRLWLAWSYDGGITVIAASQSFGGSANPVRSESGILLPPKRPQP